jgi:hypothetical protein
MHAEMMHEKLLKIRRFNTGQDLKTRNQRAAIDIRRRSRTLHVTENDERANSWPPLFL